MPRIPTLAVLVVALAGCVRAKGPVGPPGVRRLSEIPLMPPDGVAEERLTRRPLEPGLFGPPLPSIERTHPAVGRFRGKGSLSIGTTKDGFVVRCRSLPLSGPHHRVLDAQSVRNLRCGTDELVEALLKAASDVASAFEGSVLGIGNLSRVGGGDIPWSVSHNSGRDADIGLYLIDRDGRQVVPPDFVPVDVGGVGLSGDREVRLDVGRTWALVRSLLKNRDIEIQWLFVADRVREMLLREARARKEPPALITKAEQAMAQPGWSNPHDDHIHLRVYCSPDDILEGCRDWGTNRPWFVDRSRRINSRARELVRLTRSRKPSTRAAAITVLGRMGRRDALPRVVRLLNDRNPMVRVAAARAVLDIGVWGVVNRVLRAVGTVKEGEAVRDLLEALNRRLRGKYRARVLASLLTSHREFELDLDVFRLKMNVGEWALGQLEASRGSEPVRVLVEALRRKGVDVPAIEAALSRMTGLRRGDDVASTDPAVEWTRWWKANRKRSPGQWVDGSLVRSIEQD